MKRKASSRQDSIFAQYGAALIDSLARSASKHRVPAQGNSSTKSAIARDSTNRPSSLDNVSSNFFLAATLQVHDRLLVIGSNRRTLDSLFLGTNNGDDQFKNMSSGSGGEPCLVLSKHDRLSEATDEGPLLKERRIDGGEEYGPTSEESNARGGQNPETGEKDRNAIDVFARCVGLRVSVPGNRGFLNDSFYASAAALMQESPALERVLLMNYKHYQAVDDSAFISDVFDILESVSRLRNPYSQAAALLLLNLPELLPDEAFSALADHLTSKQSSDAVLLLFLIGACIGKFRRLVDVCNRQLFRVLERVDKLNSDILPLVLLPAVVATNTLASEAEAKKKDVPGGPQVELVQRVVRQLYASGRPNQTEILLLRIIAAGNPSIMSQYPPVSSSKVIATAATDFASNTRASGSATAAGASRLAVDASLKALLAPSLMRDLPRASHLMEAISLFTTSQDVGRILSEALPTCRPNSLAAGPSSSLTGSPATGAEFVHMWATKMMHLNATTTMDPNPYNGVDCCVEINSETLKLINAVISTKSAVDGLSTECVSSLVDYLTYAITCDPSMRSSPTMASLLHCIATKHGTRLVSRRDEVRLLLSTCAEAGKSVLCKAALGLLMKK